MRSAVYSIDDASGQAFAGGLYGGLGGYTLLKLVAFLRSVLIRCFAK